MNSSMSLPSVQDFSSWNDIASYDDLRLGADASFNWSDGSDPIGASPASTLVRSTSQMSLTQVFPPTADDDLPPLEASVPLYSASGSLSRTESLGVPGVYTMDATSSSAMLTLPNLDSHPMDTASYFNSLPSPKPFLYPAERTSSVSTPATATPAPAPAATVLVKQQPALPPVESKPATRSTNTSNDLSSRIPSGVKNEPPKKRARGSGPVSDETLAERRARHNKVEIRRRQKIAERFGVLRSLTDCADTDKGSILQAAIEKVRLDRFAAVGSLRCTDVLCLGGLNRSKN